MGKLVLYIKDMDFFQAVQSSLDTNCCGSTAAAEQSHGFPGQIKTGVFRGLHIADAVSCMPGENTIVVDDRVDGAR